MEDSFKELHIRIRHLSLFYYEDINEEDLNIIDLISQKDYKEIQSDEVIIKSMIILVEKYKMYFSSEKN